MPVGLSSPPAFAPNNSEPEAVYDPADLVEQAKLTEPAKAVDFLIDDDLAANVVAATVEGRADIGVSLRPPPSDSLAYRALVADEFGLVCRADDALAERQCHQDLDHCCLSLHGRHLPPCYELSPCAWCQSAFTCRVPRTTTWSPGFSPEVTRA